MDMEAIKKFAPDGCDLYAWTHYVMPLVLKLEALQHLITDTATVVDPQGESDEINLMCGLIGWASKQEDFGGWDRETFETAVRWNWSDSPAYAEEIIERFGELVPA